METVAEAILAAVVGECLSSVSGAKLAERAAPNLPETLGRVTVRPVTFLEAPFASVGKNWPLSGSVLPTSAARQDW